jgi:hypothetical protein
VLLDLLLQRCVHVAVDIVRDFEDEVAAVQFAFLSRM